ncbi:MAG: thermitase [Thermoleophilaceae bacterium]|nr:thermitase [Thermoleophilaceae bacterium]
MRHRGGVLCLPTPVHSRRLITLIATIAACLAAPAAASASDVIVAFKKDATPAQRSAVRAADDVLGGLGAVHGLGARVMRVTGSAQQASDDLAELPGVKYAEPNQRVTTAGSRAVPNDPEFGQQIGLNSPGDFDVDAPEGWALAKLGRFPSSGGARVAVVDTGVDDQHPDLAGRIAGCAESGSPLLGLGRRFTEGSCFDTNGHGTHTAGILGAATDNSEGIAGVAFNSPLLICRALGEGGLPVVDDILGTPGDGDVADVAACIEWAADHGADVISMSFESGYSSTVQNALSHAWHGGKGAVLVAAAGNEGILATRHPAGAKQVISVAATNASDGRASFSNMNDDVELAAPGDQILSLQLGGGYVRYSGTSQATPVVAGAAALVSDMHPSWTAKRIRKQLDQTADDLGRKGRDSKFGFGRLNLCNALGGSCSYKGK